MASRKSGPQGKLIANRVLIVDDDPLITKVLETGLKKAGYQVAFARHGEKATYLVLEFKPDIVILDIMLPDIDGEEICKRIRAHSETKKIKIISISAVADQDKVKAMHQAGIDAFIPKPFQIKKVVEKIQVLIGPIRAAEKTQVMRKRKKILFVIGLFFGLLGGGALLFGFLGKRKADQQQAKEEQAFLMLQELAGLAQTILEYDSNQDKQLTAQEWKPSKDSPDFDKNKDQHISRSDAKIMLQSFFKNQAKKSISMVTWKQHNLSNLAFDFLDFNKDGILDLQDFSEE